MDEPRIKLSVNSKHTESWLAPLGKLVMNFGAIEFQTYLWLAELSDEAEISATVRELFSARVQRVKRHLLASLAEEDLKSRGSIAWDRALSIAKFRNSILHNPVMFHYATADESGPPNVICMPDMKSIQNPRPGHGLATLTQINGAVDGIVACAQELHACLEKIRGTAKAITH